MSSALCLVHRERNTSKWPQWGFHCGPRRGQNEPGKNALSEICSQPRWQPFSARHDLTANRFFLRRSETNSRAQRIALSLKAEHSRRSDPQLNRQPGALGLEERAVPCSAVNDNSWNNGLR